MGLEKTICHFEITAADPQAARSFYSALFGWTIEPIPSGNEQYLLVRTADRPGALQGGIVKKSPGVEQPAIAYISVGSIDEALSKATELGGTIVIPKRPLHKVGWLATVRDPQGNLIGLFQPESGAA